MNEKTVFALEYFREVIYDLIQCIDAPDPHCTCHISPPCGDCVDWSFARESVNNAYNAMYRIDMALGTAQEEPK